MIFNLNGYIRRHTNEQLLADLRKTAKKTRKNTISNHQYRLIGAYSPSVITRRFGTWNNALQQAGLKIKKHQNIPRSRLISNLHKLWTALGRQPALSDLCPPLSSYSRRPYLRAFGSWRLALETFVATAAPSPSTEPPRPAPSAARTRRPRYINWRLRHLVMKRDNFRCTACGRSPANDPGIILHIDHIIPWRKGGETAIQNLQTLCSICNIGKSDL